MQKEKNIVINVYMWTLEKYSQCYLTLCNSKGYNPSGSSVHGILQARILEWVAMPFSGRSLLGRDLPNPEIKPRSSALQTVPLSSETPEKPRKMV